MTTHELKTLPPYFGDVFSGRKTFEIRRNDRDFQVGDELRLREWSETGGYTGSVVTVRVDYMTDFSQKDGFVVMSIRPTAYRLGYSLRYPSRRVILVEKDPQIAAKKDCPKRNKPPTES